MALVPFVTRQLTADQARRWRTFNESAPDARYTQDPRWAGVERRGEGRHERRPCFFWCERDGEICLTALGIRRRLPVPGKVFWQFDHGPTVLTSDDLDEWLTWLLPRMRRQVSKGVASSKIHLDRSLGLPLARPPPLQF